ncbi:MAG: hypothetical protein KDD43_01820 [Bdellovibrionales bacterium]|nr:hypothetical protein [Bdellovibrionales bacterium]
MEDLHSRTWCLFNSETKSMVKEVNLLQIRAMLMIIDPDHRSHFWVWKEGYKGWMPIMNCTPALRPLTKAQTPLYPPPPPGEDFSYAEEDEEKERVLTLDDVETSMIDLETVITKVGFDEHGGETSELPSSEGNAALAYTPQHVYELQEHTGVTQPLDLDHKGFVEKREVIRYKRQYKVIIEIDGNQHVTQTKNLSVKSIQVEGKLPYWIPHQSFQLILERYGEQIKVTCHPYGDTRDQVLMIDVIDEPGIYQKWLLEW